MTELSSAQIESAIRPYHVPIGPGMADKIRAYVSLLLKWNRTISLTTVTDPTEILKFHFGESLFSISELKFGGSRLADVGSGAGFPGFPLAMAVPALDVVLIESNARKCAFLSEVKRDLQLSNVTVFRGRMEDFPAAPPKFDFITARAIGHHDELLAWARKHLSADGKIVLWIGDEDVREISLVPHWNWEKSILIPGSERRYLLAGSPSI